MKKMVIALPMLLLAVPASAKTHNDMFDVSCKTLWPAVKDTLRNSGKYGIIGIENSEMTASYNIGGTLTGKRLNSLVLNPKGDNSCEMQVQTAYSGPFNNDEGDFKKRVTESLDKLKAQGAGKPEMASPEAAKPAANPAQQ